MRFPILVCAFLAAGVGCRRDPPEPVEKIATVPAAREVPIPAPKVEGGVSRSTSDPDQRGEALSEVEKARLIRDKRKEARDILEKFKAGGEKNIKLLEEYTELHHQNTEIAPSTCPKCWAEYAEALSMLGWKYWYDYQDLQVEIKKAEPARMDELKAKAKDLTAKWTDYFTRSNQAYETHFKLGDTQLIHPYSYERVMRHWELLGNYDRALFFLEKCVEGYPLLRGGLDEPKRQKFDKLRGIYKQELQKKKEAKVMSEETDPSGTPPDRR